jgi:hypothetical protein
MNDRVGAAERLGQAGDIGEVVLGELSAGIGDPGRPRWVAHQRHDLVTACPKAMDDRRSDEPGTAGDDDPERGPRRRSRTPSRWPCPARLAQATP